MKTGRKKKESDKIKVQCFCYIEGQVVDKIGKEKVKEIMYRAVLDHWESIKIMEKYTS